MDTAALEFKPNYSLYYGFSNKQEIRELNRDSILEIPNDWGISKHGKMTIGSNDQKIFFVEKRQKNEKLKPELICWQSAMSKSLEILNLFP